MDPRLRGALELVLQHAAPSGRSDAAARVWWARVMAIVVDPVVGDSQVSESAAGWWSEVFIHSALDARTWERVERQIAVDADSCWKGLVASEGGHFAAGDGAGKRGVGKVALPGVSSCWSLSTETTASLLRTRIERLASPDAKGWQVALASIALPTTGAESFRWSVRITAGSTAVMSGLCFARADATQSNLHNSADAVAFSFSRNGGVLGKMPGVAVRGGPQSWGGAKVGDVVGFRFLPRHGTVHISLNGVELATHVRGIGGAQNRNVFNNCIRMRAFVAMAAAGTCAECTTPVGAPRAAPRPSAAGLERAAQQRQAQQKGCPSFFKDG